MRGTYAVSLGNRQVGKVQVLRQGLYYRFVCRCEITGEVMCRLWVASGDKRQSLGLVVPMDGGFGLDTRVPAKRLGTGEMTFCLLPKHEHGSKFVPIYPEEPFAYIESLKDGFLAIQDGQIGLMVMK